MRKWSPLPRKAVRSRPAAHPSLRKTVVWELRGHGNRREQVLQMRLCVRQHTGGGSTIPPPVQSSDPENGGLTGRQLIAP